MERSPGRTQAPQPEPSRAEQSRAEALGRVELKCAPGAALGHLLSQLPGAPGSGLTRSKNARPPPWSKKKKIKIYSYSPHLRPQSVPGAVIDGAYTCSPWPCASSHRPGTFLRSKAARARPPGPAPRGGHPNHPSALRGPAPHLAKRPSPFRSPPRPGSLGSTPGSPAPLRGQGRAGFGKRERTESKSSWRPPAISCTFYKCHRVKINRPAGWLAHPGRAHGSTP